MQISARKTIHKYNENKFQYIIGNRRNGGKIVRTNTYVHELSIKI
jgi:hypothetical protein